MHHCDLRSLEEFFQGGDVDSTEIAGHLISCKECYRSAAEVIANLGESGCQQRKLAPVAHALRELIRAEEAQLREEVRAKCLVSLLLSLDVDKQKRFIRSDPRARSREFVLALVRAAREKVLSDPATTTSMCNYGLILVADLGGLKATMKTDITCELLTELANARRLQADRGTANQLLDRAYKLIQTGSCNPFLVARIGSIRASVRLDSGQPEDALLILEDVRQKYEVAAAPHEAGRTMVQIADIVSV